MAWPLRKCLPEVTYHCYSRCIELRNLLSPDFVKDIAAEAINRALDKYDFELIQVEFVENHFHLIIRTKEHGETISRIMQYIKARITEGYNRKMGRTGTLWNERFRCTIVEESDNPERYFFYLMWYIAYNPVRKGVMKNPRESKHGTIRAYLEEGFVSTIRITLHYYFINLGYSFEERAKRFLEYEDIYLKRYSHVF